MMPKTLIVIACAVSLLAFSASADLRAGAAKRSIVPPFPTHMGGFGDRMAFFEGVHDDVFVRALVLDDGAVHLAILGSDLMALEEQLTQQVRDRVHQATNIPPQNILVSCVHNHSAPSWYQYESEADKQKARDFFTKQFADAAIEAFESRVPAEIGYANGQIIGATRNRQQDNDTVIDSQVGVLRVEELDGRGIIATLFNFTGHPVIQGSRNLLLSGEWPGAASRTVEQVLGGVAIPTQGACGDITVNREGDPWDEIERLGRLVAGEVIKTAESIRPSAEARLAAAQVEFDLAPKQLPSAADAKAQLDASKAALDAANSSGASQPVVRLHENRVRMFEATAKQASDLEAGALERPDTYPGSVQVVQIADLVLVAIPGELFVEYALEMRQRIGQVTGKSTCIVGYANGHVGYIVTPRAMETGGYEASVARVEVGAGRRMTEEAVNLAIKIVQ